jgi:hypothetical protein
MLVVIWIFIWRQGDMNPGFEFSTSVQALPCLGGCQVEPPTLVYGDSQGITHHFTCNVMGTCQGGVWGTSLSAQLPRVTEDQAIFVDVTAII